MFTDWYKRADTTIPHLELWQDGKLRQLLKKAYEAGRIAGREEAIALAENAAVLREKLRKPF